MRRVVHLLLDLEQVEHLLDVDQRLLDLAVHEAEEVERLVELHQVGVGHHEAAQGHRAVDDGLPGHQHHRGEPGGDDRGLADVEQRERLLALHRRALVPPERLVITPRLVLLVAEVLHRLEVEQRVDRLGVRAAVGLVHRAPELDAPLRDRHRVADVGDHGDQRDQRDGDVQRQPQDHEHQRQLDQRRDDVEQAEAQQDLDRAHAALDGAREPAGLAPEVEAQRQRVQVAEHLERDAADGALADAREHRVPDLAEGERQHARGAVREDHPHRQGQREVRVAPVAAQRVHRLLVEERHDHHRHLGADQEQHRDRHPQAHVRRVRGPQVGQQAAQRADVAEGARRVVRGGAEGSHGDCSASNAAL